MLQGKTVVLGVTGSIAAYKIASLASCLVKLHADVHVIMTQNATHFITPITFETLTGNKCLVDTFDRNFQFHVAHVSLAQRADLMLIAPASANVIGKMANGIADDMLTTTVMACTAPVLISPAMNTHMYENPIVQDNLDKLRRFGYTVIEPAVGMLACRDVGAGKMPEPEVLLDYILREIACEKDLQGKKILVTAGPTQEALDPVRYLTNHSTGKMGYAIARCAMLRGAEVTLVTGVTALEPPPFVEVVHVVSAAEMFDAVISRAPEQDAVIKSAAVADYRPAEIAAEKQKKHDGEMQIPLTRTQDILAYLGEHKREGQFLCGFSMETQNMLENSREKLKRKHLDMICANNLKVLGAGFGTDTNVVTLIQKDSERELPLLSKEAVGDAILDIIRDFWHNV
ncbi:bifunctional phosphopantothenoylcysteine decarboxylase/phosphopantothenate--cysteine ligase CoaBC [Ruminococcus sp.]|uniref:bifunctional phosphopantothenoylcysteine decarboxylase/phosphopantothenate--cysteine ligase CoaBC n=1 Tax=Ruminococcus sp. TaxID=41978 RepID=UPI0025E13489|nr:bifunctional phosphopantothenoylcysteine decarboxylase/phosphopantothenate--cysteine ligase CoaBC [Ruminococcus sp.]